ncbi:hypothetical protein BG004_000731 [Podila humilis]|nr:hypothetical protein BG004_000731 [Podila humilis]
MARQRSQSTSSMGTMAKSPTSLVASLSTSVALYDSLQPPKSLQDILLLAQSHYISHRYVPALTLYKLAAEQHHSLPACCSLYALYTSTRKEPGLIRSDTKAIHILIHALRIWTARRWSSSRLFDDESKSRSALRSRIRDEHDELEEYFVHSSNRSSLSSKKKKKKNTQPPLEVKSIGQQILFQSQSSGRRQQVHGGEGGRGRQYRSEGTLVSSRGARSGSTGSEYRNYGILKLSNHDNPINSKNESDIRNSLETFSGDEGGHRLDSSASCSSFDEGDDDDDDDDGYIYCDDSDESDECEDEAQEKEEEARRIGLATAEIEDIIQKTCFTIQKGVLALDEPIVIEAVAMLRKIERGLSTEAEVWQEQQQHQQEQSRSLFTSSLSGSTLNGSKRNDTLTSTDPGLLLTQGVDLSFLNLSPAEESVMVAQSKPLSPVTSRAIKVAPLMKQGPVNRNILNLPSKEQEMDMAICRAIRIRVMFTLGWVHQRLGEYHYGALAFGICSDITPKTGKRLLDSLQQEATVQKFTCIAYEKKALEQAQKEEAERKLLMQPRSKEQPKHSPIRSSTTPALTPTVTSSKSLTLSPTSAIKPQMGSLSVSAASSCASSVYNSSESCSAITHRPDISNPSSPSTSDTSMIIMPSNHGASMSSSLSAWGSGLFKMTKATATPTKSTSLYSTSDKGMEKRPRLQRSKSASHRLKINTLDALTIADEVNKDRDSNKPHMQVRPSKPTATPPSLAPSLTMTAHQTQVVKCGHCGQKRVLMPLCVCKKVRYCNRECRLADMEEHRKTGCHSAMIGSATGLGVVVSVNNKETTAHPATNWSRDVLTVID